MKRNPRWMAMFVLMIVMMTFGAPGRAQISRQAMRLPEPGDTIGDPDMPGGGKNRQAMPGGYTIIPIAGGLWTIRLGEFGISLRVMRAQAGTHQQHLVQRHD